jgi:hypothetical protein
MAAVRLPEEDGAVVDLAAARWGNAESVRATIEAAIMSVFLLFLKDSPFRFGASGWTAPSTENDPEANCDSCK